MREKIARYMGVGILLGIILLGCAILTYSAVSQIAGLAVANGTVWNNVQDASVGDNLVKGIFASGIMAFDGAGFDRVRGDSVNGLDVDVTRLAGIVATSDNTANPANKLPILPCRVELEDTTGIFTVGNIAPCTVNTSGATFVAQKGIQNSSIGVANTVPMQSLFLFNSQTTGAANTAVVITIAAATNQRAYIRSLEAQCSSGTSTITIQDGATTIFTSMGANVPAAIATYRREWPTGLTGTTNTAMTITLAACGVGNTGTLHVNADRV